MVTKQIIKSKTFEKQIEEVLNGTYPRRSMLVVRENTPILLQKIGLRNLPIMMTQKHFYTITSKTGIYKNVNYHNIGINTIKNLPKALERPLYVFKSDTKKGSIVVVTKLYDSLGNIIVASIKVDGKAQLNDIQFDSNVLTSAYGKSVNYNYFINKNIIKGNLLYSFKKGIVQKIRK